MGLGFGSSTLDLVTGVWCPKHNAKGLRIGNLPRVVESRVQDMSATLSGIFGPQSM